jgi:hypothetical protein
MKRITLRQRTAYTLLELVICIPATTLLLLGMASAIQLARRAFPDGNSITSATVAGQRALDLFAGDLAYATSIPARSATGITLVAPDRTGDAAPDTVIYLWSGTVGSPLTRQVNGSAPETILPGVQDFALTYDTAVDPQSGQTILQAANVRLAVPTSGLARLEARPIAFNAPLFP